jgi:hypothetical protein
MQQFVLVERRSLRTVTSLYLGLIYCHAHKDNALRESRVKEKSHTFLPKPVDYATNKYPAHYKDFLEKLHFSAEQEINYGYFYRSYTCTPLSK